jgi:hypothetical protein
LEKKRMAASKAFAGAELVLGILVILVSLLWCYVLPDWSLTYLYWIIIGLGALIAIVAAVALARN